MSHVIYPTSGSVGQFQGFDSRELQEEQLANWMKIRSCTNLPNFLYTGGALSAAGGLAVNIAALTAMVSGRVVQTTGSESLSGLTDTASNYIYLQVSYSSGLATDFTFVSNTTGVLPSESAFIGLAVASGGSVTSVAGAVYGSPVNGTYTGSAAAGRNVFLGFQPKAVCVYGDNGGVNLVYAQTAFGGFGGSGAGFGFNIVDVGGGTATTVGPSAFVPVITATGFQVSNHVADGLNNSAITYYYSAWV